MPFVTQTAESAKKFLLTKLQEQSARDNLTLTESEKRLFVFSEKTASTADVQGVKEFDASGGDGDYEAKIARLLRRAYRFDKKASRASSWKDALTALRDEDFYGLVMVDQAQIPRPAAWIGAFGWRFFTFAGVTLTVIAGTAIFVLDPFGWHWITALWAKLALMVLAIAIIWVYGDLSKG